MNIPEPIDPALAVNERIDKICIRYEDCWLEGEPPRLESFIDQVDTHDQPALVYELLCIDLACGPRRELLTEEAYRARLPDFQAVIQAVFRKRPPARSVVPFRSGQSIGGFRVEREIGRGGFGAVYLARDVSIGRNVALKTLRPDIASADTSRQRLLEEAKLAGALHHPGIAAIYGVEAGPDGQPVLVYQYVEGESLRERLRGEPMSFDEIAELMSQLALALQDAHEHGVIHCDLQPNNVLLTNDGRPVITDFGLAAHEWIRPARMGEVAGSPPYLAPEQTRGDARQLDARTDVWALGVILYEMLTGTRPFGGDSTAEILTAIQDETPEAPQTLDDLIPAALSDITMRCLQKSPQDRFPSAAAMHEALQDNSPAPRSSRRIFAVAGLGLLFTIPLVAWLLFLPPSGNAPTWQVDSQMLVRRRGSWFQAGAASSPAVGAGDQVRFQLQLDRPAYIYVVWIDGAGVAAPVHPWPNGDWRWPSQPQPKPQEQLRQFATPPSLAESWTMQVAEPATESVVVLVRPTPLPADVDLQSAFRNLPAQTSLGDDATVVRFQNGLVALEGGSGRSPSFDAATRSQHGVFKTQQLLWERLRPHFPVVHSFSFAVFP